jgi:tetratricopeptide (TPR) repeat protein
MNPQSQRREDGMNVPYKEMFTRTIPSCLAIFTMVSPGSAQVPIKAPAANPPPTVQQAIQMVQDGRCSTALPALKRALPRITDKDLKYHAAMGLTRCAMSVQDDQASADALLLLIRDFPDDPEVLYIASHYFSEMGMRAANDLIAKAPSSFQARKLQGEALESQGKNQEAAAVYSQILVDHPQTPGIHYRLGQILLAEAGATGSTDAAKLEFQKELEVDPLNAASEFILGELARRLGQWDDATAYFTRATTLDIGFAEAYLALGMSLNASGKFANAIKPLEGYVKMQPADPAGHYQLAMAYARTGNTQGSTQQLALQAKAMSNAQTSTDTTEGHAAPH